MDECGAGARTGGKITRLDSAGHFLLFLLFLSAAPLPSCSFFRASHEKAPQEDLTASPGRGAARGSWLRGRARVLSLGHGDGGGPRPFRKGHAGLCHFVVLEGSVG